MQVYIPADMNRRDPTGVPRLMMTGLNLHVTLCVMILDWRGARGLVESIHGLDTSRQRMVQERQEVNHLLFRKYFVRLVSRVESLYES